MLNWHPLWRTGRTRGIHNAAQIFGAGRCGLDWIILAKLLELIEAVQRQVVEGSPQIVDVFLLDFSLAAVDDVFHVLGFLERVD